MNMHVDSAQGLSRSYVAVLLTRAWPDRLRWSPTPLLLIRRQFGLAPLKRHQDVLAQGDGAEGVESS